MQIACPECPSKFIVKPNQIGEGRKVQCSACEHVWFQHPLPADEQSTEQDVIQNDPEHVDPIGKGSNVPAIIDSKPLMDRVFGGLIYAMLAVLLVSFSITGANSLMQWMPFLSNYYAMFDLYPTTGIAVYDVKLEALQTDGKPNQTLSINAAIVNESKDYRTMPAVRVTLYNATNQIITTKHYPQTHHKIPPQGETLFQKTITPLPKGATRLVFDIGHKMDIAGR